MKRIVSLLLTVLLLLAFCLPAGAAGNGALNLSGANGDAGSNVTVQLSLADNPGLITLKLSVSFDSDLELTKVEDAGALKNLIPAQSYASPYTLFWKDSLATADNTVTGRLSTLTFHIKDTATPGDKKITVNAVDSYDVNGQQNTFTGVSATVHVNEPDDEPCPHEWTVTNVIPQTCSSFLQTIYTCGLCGETKVDFDSSQGLGSHNYGDWTVTLAATCTTPGTETRVCSICQRKETKVIMATGHTYGAWQVTTAADCTHDGERSRTCSVCTNVEYQTVPRTGHDYRSFEVIRNPTCTESGLKRGTCKNCGSINAEEPIAPLGHSFGEWADTLAATCTEGGMRVRNCTRCTAKEEEETEPLGHEFVDPIVVRVPSLYATGLIKGLCSRCNESTDQETPCQVTDSMTGIHIETTVGVFPEGASMNSERITSGDARLNSLTNALSEIATTFTAYDINFTVKGNPIQPTGTYAATFPIPQGYNGELVVCYVGEDGVAVPLNTATDVTTNTVKADLYAGGVYAVCLLGGGMTINRSNLSDTSLGSLWVYILLIAVILIMIALVVLLILSRKKTPPADDAVLPADGLPADQPVSDIERPATEQAAIEQTNAHSVPEAEVNEVPNEPVTDPVDMPDFVIPDDNDPK